MTNKTNIKLKIGKKSFWPVAVFVVGLVALLQLFVAHLLSGKGETLVRIEEKSQMVVSENEALQEELYKYSSLSEIAARGSKLGYIKPQSIKYFDNVSSATFLGLNNLLEKR